jgi:hypothetical protein
MDGHAYKDSFLVSNDFALSHPPQHVIVCNADGSTILARHKKKSEIEEMSEEQQEEFN